MFAFFVCVAAISFPRVHHGLFTIGYVSGHSWVGHYFLHQADIPVLSEWHRRHHDDDNKEVSQSFLTRLTEFVINIAFAPGLLLTYVVPDDVLHHEVVILYSIVYCTVHLVNYHRRKDIPFHAQHHGDVSVNYGPSYVDATMGTERMPTEDVRHYVPNFVLTSLVMLLVRYLL